MSASSHRDVWCTSDELEFLARLVDKGNAEVVSVYARNAARREWPSNVDGGEVVRAAHRALDQMEMVRRVAARAVAQGRIS